MGKRKPVALLGILEMDMVCKQLSSPDANGVQSCLQWGQADLYLPPLSYAEATTIGGAFWLCLAVVWSLKTIRVQIFEK
ncbi:hypothetical protein ABAYE1851 [Acinetobacter baumannii AYE]|nr:hypothetical protein [Acinetobacter baumannii]CAM86735.1 hypothetical protein ABAYE1851 [Acinetobacter baumannii AYE]